MEKFIVAPHFRLHEWVAKEKGYFEAEGLDYEFRELVKSTAGAMSTIISTSVTTKKNKPITWLKKTFRGLIVAQSIRLLAK